MIEKVNRFNSFCKFKILIVWITFFSFNSLAAEYTESFTDRSVIDSTELVFNQFLGALHPQLQVMNFKPGFVPLLVEVGEGRDGSFDPSTYALFSMNGDLSGQIIRLDTERFEELQVTNFILAQGWILELVGIKPLIIKSLSDVIIEGEILCSGQNGQDAINNTLGLGGEGRCGGQSGGDGGSPMNDGEDGNQLALSTITGGGGGNYRGLAMTAVGGGGGGAFNTSSPASDGFNFNINGGQAGSSVSDPEFLIPVGSAGGGGGSGTDTDAGAGGGGGGGVVRIYAVRDFILGQSPGSIFGTINVNGGNGGSSNVLGGSGGGGGAGSVSVFVGRNIEIFNTDGLGASLASGGNGGTNANGDPGASGAIGRNWFSSVGYNLSGTGFYTPAEDAPITPGNVEFISSAQEFISQSIEFKTTLLQINSISTTPSSSDFTVQVSGSDDNFVSDQTHWTSNFAEISGKRFIKFKVIITTSNVNSGTFLDSLTINYSFGQQDDFDFVATSCAMIKNNDLDPSGSLIIILLPLLLLIYLRLFSLKQIEL